MQHVDEAAERQAAFELVAAREIGNVENVGQHLFGLLLEAHTHLDRAAIREVASLKLSLVGLKGFEDYFPSEISGGMQKRAGLARAMALDPVILFFDEPSAGQDHRNATRFMAAVRTIGGLENLFFVTHDVDLALTHADRILLFRDGRIVADGPPGLVVEDEHRWIECNLRPTSLMRANAATGVSGPFLEAQALARRIVEGRAAPQAPGTEHRVSDELVQ